jgi:hypothetical protein
MKPVFNQKKFDATSAKVFSTPQPKVLKKKPMNKKKYPKPIPIGAKEKKIIKQGYTP